MTDFFNYFIAHWDEISGQILEHINLTLLALLLSGSVGIVLGILISRYERLSRPVLNFAGILQTIPSIALLGFLIPILGIGYQPALFALFLYSLLPIIRNTLTGLKNVDPAVVEAARGMGMSSGQILFKVELPLAAPVIFAGLRTAAVIAVGLATLAAYIGAGGLGEMIFGGIALNNSMMILSGAIPASILALFFDGFLATFEKLSYKKTVFASAFIALLLVGYGVSYTVQLFEPKQLTAGFEPEFTKRQDGYPGIQKTYGLDIPVITLGASMLYDAIKEKEVDVISGYSTDGRIKSYDLYALKDDRQFFPPYQASFILRTKTLRKYPQLKTVLEKLSGQIDSETMTQLNYRADELKISPDSVAIDFLKEKGLYKPSGKSNGPELIIGSKIFTEQYILTAMCKYMIEGHTNLRLRRKNGLGGTKICFEALYNDEIALYPEYSGTGLQVILKSSQFTADSLQNDSQMIYNYVQQEFNNRYEIQWLKPMGFNNTYALMMRREQAEKIGVESISDLAEYLNEKQ